MVVVVVLNKGEENWVWILVDGLVGCVAGH